MLLTYIYFNFYHTVFGLSVNECNHVFFFQVFMMLGPTKDKRWWPDAFALCSTRIPIALKLQVTVLLYYTGKMSTCVKHMFKTTYVKHMFNMCKDTHMFNMYIFI